LQNEDNQDQSLITIDQMIVQLKQNEEKTITLNALCCNKNFSSPDEDDTFSLSFIHKDKIGELVKLLDKYKCYDNTAQQAMWCFTDEADIASIYNTNEDTLIENQLVLFTANTLQKPIPTKHVFHSAKKREITYPLEFEGKVKVRVDAPTTIGFYLTDSTNNIIDVIIADELENRVGTATFS
jgi:hypothetical protein